MHRVRAESSKHGPIARILVFGATVCLLVTVSSVSAATVSHSLSAPVREADDYYLGRQDLANVLMALRLAHQAAVKNPEDYEAWWRISKFNCYLARHSAGSERIKLLQAAIDAGKKAVALAPNRVEGHFWLGANLGLMAEARGFLKGLSLVESIRTEMKTVIRIDPNYEEAGGLRTLARLDYRAPFFKGGDKKRSIDLLQEALKRFPHNSLAMLYLADSYMALGRRAQAREQLENILRLCPDPLYGPEQEENQEEARARLTRYFASTKR